MKAYEKSHPWLTFQLDLRRVPIKLWMLLGEAQSKCEHIAGVPLDEKIAEQFYEVYLAKGIMATTAIEGNTLSEDEVKRRIEGKSELSPSKEYMGQEVDNVLKAFNLMADRIFSKEKSPILCTGLVKEYNRIILENLQLEKGVIPGEIRSHSVGVADYRGAPAEDCEYLLNKLFEWLNNMDKDLNEFAGQEISFGLLKAIIAHIYFAWIHPFGDGNGRTARLIECQLLLESGVPKPTAHLLSNHYNSTRSEYYRQLQRASASKGDIIPFIEYAIAGFVDQLKSQIKDIRYYQWENAWRCYIYDLFKGKTSISDRRRLELALAISDTASPINSIVDMQKVTPEIALIYANKYRILARDVEELIKMDLIEKTEKGYLAKKGKILAFLPDRKVKEDMVQQLSELQEKLPGIDA
jgi:Fic family protein